jgi:hypothetical protein
METLEELKSMLDKKKFELFVILKKQDKRRNLNYKKDMELLLIYEIMELNKLIKEKNGKK